MPASTEAGIIFFTVSANYRLRSMNPVIIVYM